VIYCDPPYQGTTKYSSKTINYNEFWQWCRDLSGNNIVLVSEYNAPDDFECVWSKTTLANFDSNRDFDSNKKKRIEKLFKYQPTTK
jgi:DNA adenine methylase